MSNESLTAVNPKILKWARESAHLTVQQVAEKIKKPESVVMAWEEGSQSPTWSQLEKVAYELYKRPTAIFFFPAPPTIDPKPTQFRSMPGRDLELLQPQTVYLIRKARAWQIALAELFNGKSPVETPIWKQTSLDINANSSIQAETIRKILLRNLNYKINGLKPELALKEWRKVIEACGVFVFKHSFKQKDISGFCLEDEEFPIIVLNNSTSFTRQIFSLMHELAHIVLRRDSICSLDDSIVQRLTDTDLKIEVFCNSMASYLLVEESEFNHELKDIKIGEVISDEFINRLASQFSVSRAVITRRLLDLNYISSAYYAEKTETWDQQIRHRPDHGGGNFYYTQNSYLSQNFLREIFAQHSQHRLSLDEAAELIGIPAKNFEGLEAQFLQSAI